MAIKKTNKCTCGILTDFLSIRPQIVCKCNTSKDTMEGDSIFSANLLHYASMTSTIKKSTDNF